MSERTGTGTTFILATEENENNLAGDKKGLAVCRETSERRMCANLACDALHDTVSPVFSSNLILLTGSVDLSAADAQPSWPGVLLSILSMFSKYVRSITGGVQCALTSCQPESAPGSFDSGDGRMSYHSTSSDNILLPSSILAPSHRCPHRSPHHHDADFKLLLLANPFPCLYHHLFLNAHCA